MAEYISREAVLSKCAGIWDNADETTQTGVDIINTIDKITDFIESLPAADVQPVKHGRWVITDDVEHFIAVCSVCGRTVDSRCIKDMPYCHCGARMESVKDVDVKCSKSEYAETYLKPFPQPCILCGNNCQVSLSEQFKVRNELCKEREQMYRGTNK